MQYDKIEKNDINEQSCMSLYDETCLQHHDYAV